MNYIPRIIYGPASTLVQFVLPPEADPFGESVSAINQTTTAANGQIQNNQKYVLRLNKMKFSLVTETTKAAFDAFLTTWGNQKKSFLYYPHSDVDTDVVTVTLEDDTIAFARDMPAVDGFLYSFTMNLRRVI